MRNAWAAATDRSIPRAERPELRALTSLRGIAAMAVVLVHFSATAQNHSRVVIPSLAPHGYVAVDFFFVLSGFIMAYTYLGSFEQSPVAAYGPFLLKRAARIVPLNLAVLLLTAILGAASIFISGHNIFFRSANWIFDFAANAAMLQGLGIGTNLNGPSWSISTEFAAYVLFPVFVAAVFRRYLLWPTLAAAVAALLWLALQQPRLAVAGEAPPASVIRCFAEFVFGLAAYRLSMHKVSSLLYTDSATLTLAMVALGSLVLRCDLPAVFVFPFLVVAFSGNTGLAARIVGARPIYSLGVISFSVYLFHQLFRPIELSLWRVVAPEPVGMLPALLFAAAGSCSVIPFAWLAYVTVERPGRKAVRAIVARWPGLRESGASRRAPSTG